jgi:hypothetical protein
MQIFIKIISQAKSQRLLVSISFTHVHTSQDDDVKSLFSSVGSKIVQISRCYVGLFHSVRRICDSS